jgi:hypothetical protein
MYQEKITEEKELIKRMNTVLRNLKGLTLIGLGLFGLYWRLRK